MKENFDSLIHGLVHEKRDIIKSIFSELVKKWSNCVGFIGFEDMEGMISILFSHNEKFFHMKATEGFTGWVYGRGTAEIYDKNKFQGRLEKPSEDMEKPGFSEMVATIKYVSDDLKEKNVGVILIDKFQEPKFTQKDLQQLKNAASNVSKILSNVNPWNLRNWWQAYEKDCTDRYHVNVREQLIAKLDAYQDISISTQLFKTGKLMNPIEINATTYSKKAGGSVLEKVLLTGASHSDPTSLTQGLVGVPFPMSGPLRGVISVRRLVPHEDQKKEEMELEKIQESVIDVVESIEYPIFKEVFDSKDAGVKMFSILNRCYANDSSLELTLAEICNEFGVIGNARIELFLTTEFLDESLGSGTLHITGAEEIAKKFLKNENHSFRPRYWMTDQNKYPQLKCGIYIGRKLVGGILSTPIEEEQIQVDMDGPIIEVFSTFLSKLLSRFKKSRSLNILLDKISEVERIQEVDFFSHCIDIFECNYFGVVTFKPDGKVSHMTLKSDHQLDDLKISENKMGSILGKLDLSKNYININNTEEGIKELKLSHDKELVQEFNRFKVRSLMIKRVDENRVMLAVTHREKSFKRFFDREDKDNLSVLALLYKMND